MKRKLAVLRFEEGAGERSEVLGLKDKGYCAFQQIKA